MILTALSLATAGTAPKRRSSAPSRPVAVLPNSQSDLLRIAGAAVVYVAFLVYLYRPYFGGFQTWQWLMPINVFVGALGCFVVSRRWISGFSGSLLAGAVYGFGPFMLGLMRYHPTVGFLAACVPWLFVPAAFWARRRSRFVGFLSCLLPFAGVVLFFRLGALDALRHYAAPIQAEPQWVDLVGFIAPLVVVGRGAMLASIYHIPTAALVLGVAMMVKARRYSLLVMAVAGVVLAMCRPLFGPQAVAWLGVSPILWLSIPMVCISLLAGLGLQGLLEAGRGDRKWILAAGITLGAFAIATLLLAARYFQVVFHLADGYARLFVDAAKIYLMGALATGIVYVIARQSLRFQPLRWVVLCAALAFDIFLGARYIVDKLL